MKKMIVKKDSREVFVTSIYTEDLRNVSRGGIASTSFRTNDISEGIGIAVFTSQ